LLAPEPADRYETAAGVLADLELFQTGKEPHARALGFPVRLDEAPTRRTRPPADPESEATRRTQRAAAIPEPVVGPPTVHRNQGVAAAHTTAGTPAPVRTRSTRSHPIRTLLMLAALLLVSNELVVGFKASRIAATVVTRDLDGLDDVWTAYDALSHRSYLRLGIVRLESLLATRVGTLSDQVIANYRSTLPTVRERQWRTAQRNLQHALGLARRSASLEASLRYCEGHLHRIDGEAEKLRRHTAAANQHFTEAVTAFREAAELRRDWPDPFLGLARTFIYGLEDIDRAADALKQAQKLGYATGDRETAQLADGYRARGDSLWQTARQLADMPQEAEYLQRATDAYRQAQGLYERIPGYSGVAVNLRRTRRAIDQIDQRATERAIDREGDDTSVTVPDRSDRIDSSKVAAPHGSEPLMPWR
jgi:hypothetical protein